jgi:hypothetical protein
MAIQWSNNASGALAVSISDTDTTIILSAGQGVEFPTPVGTDYFYATLTDSSNNLEVIKVTARSADVFTVVRGQDNTTARAYLAGDVLELRPTAAGLTDMQAFPPSGTLASTRIVEAIQELDTETLKSATVTAGTGLTGGGTITPTSTSVTLEPAAGYNGYGVRTVSTSDPTGGNDGDIWFKV